jgi:hypothetical protein
MKINSDLVGLKWLMVLIGKNNYLVRMRENQSRPSASAPTLDKKYYEDI